MHKYQHAQGYTYCTVGALKGATFSQQQITITVHLHSGNSNSSALTVLINLLKKYTIEKASGTALASHTASA